MLPDVLENPKNATIYSEAVHHAVSMHAPVVPFHSKHGHEFYFSRSVRFSKDCSMNLGIVHDHWSDFEDNKCPTDPDIAGFGVS